MDREELKTRIHSITDNARKVGKYEALTDIREIIYKTINPTQTLKDILSYIDEAMQEGHNDN